MCTNGYLQLPPFYENVRAVFNILAMDLVRVLDFGCTLAEQNHYISLLLTSLLPIAFIVILFVFFFIISHLCKV